MPPFTITEWATWLADAERRLREVYRLSPERLIAEYRREREVTRGYHGREILELLQNAGDAARMAGVQGRVHICVSAHGVVIGNTGQTFDAGGVRSLQTANLSPKRQRESAVIGDKGLGFRSILNWTHSPLISSGSLGLAFLPSYAATVLADLEAENDVVADWVSKERGHAGDLITPRLAFPKWIPDWANTSWEADDGQRAIAETCQRLRTEGFDTAVGMPFSHPHAQAESIRQLKELGPEFLLLVDSISVLEIVADGLEPKIWRCDPDGHRQTVRENERVIGSWTVAPFSGELPPDLVDPEEPTKNAFNLIVAVPEQVGPRVGRLFCYFPTDVELALPLLAHATVQLDETRKHLNDSRANRHILRCLAESIAKIAEERAGISGVKDWAGCRLVVPGGATGGDLEKLGFWEHLKQVARSKRLVPVLKGDFCRASDARIAPQAGSAWLPARHFPEIAVIERQEEQLLAIRLEVSALASTTIAERMLQITDLTLTERANAIAGLLRIGLPHEKYSSRLLCDETGQPLPEGTTAILQLSGTMPALPVWATIRFLHPELRKLLSELLRTTEGRELQQKLRPFGVIEYSLAALIGPVLAEANRQVREEPEAENTIRREALEFLWKSFEGLGGAGQIAAFPVGVSLKLPTQGGGFASPAELYLGEGYGTDGNITQDLFGSWAKEKLIEGTGKLGLGPLEVEALTQFLMWLGVVRWPREVPAEQVESAFVVELVNSLRYPAQFEDYTFQRAGEVAEAKVADAKTIERLNDILLRSPPEAVTAWLGRDSRSSKWAVWDVVHGRLTARRGGAHNPRAYVGPIVSYVRWQIGNTEWLPTAAGTKAAPRQCLLGERLIETLFPRPAEPNAALGARYGVTEGITQSYVRAGVMPGLSQLSRDEIYHLLLELPPHSPDGKTSKALCRWFLQHESDLFGVVGEYQQRFFREGKMWGSKNGVASYFAVTKLRHVDADGLPAGLLKELAVADLPKRVGSDKVKRLFAITALDRSGIHQELLLCRESPDHDLRSDWFESAKPYLRCLRDSQTTQIQSLGSLGRLKLIVCDELRIRLTHEGAAYEYETAEGEWFIFTDTLYVRGDAQNSLDLLADAVGSAIASIFRLADGDSFSKLLHCEPTNRAKLLRRMCGDDFLDEIQQAEASQRRGYAGPIIPPVEKPPSEAEPPHTPPAEPKSGMDGGATNEESATKDSMGEKRPGVKQVEHKPEAPQAQRRLVMRKVKRAPSRTGSERKLVDGEKCEEMVLMFETLSARFAIPVGHLTGNEAPGCDILSFATAADRQTFEDPATRDWAKVLRYIEVKGRSSSTAKIELRGNELTAARKQAASYYLYRVYEQSADEFMVTVLQDPLGAEEAKSLAVQIDLERANATERFEFVAEPQERLARE